MSLAHLSAHPLRAAAPLLALCAAPMAFSADELHEPPTEAAATTWTCRYDGQTRILCRLSSATDPPADGDEAQPADGAAETDPVYGRLPPLVQQIHLRPAQLRGQTIVIPIYSHPFGRERVEQLADAIMCGGKSSCRVDFAHDAADFSAFEEIDPARE